MRRSTTNARGHGQRACVPPMDRARTMRRSTTNGLAYRQEGRAPTMGCASRQEAGTRTMRVGTANAPGTDHGLKHGRGVGAPTRGVGTGKGLRSRPTLPVQFALSHLSVFER